jgi:hypothetical protein
MQLRGEIADLMAGRSPFLRPLTALEIQRALGAKVSLAAIKRHRAWLARAAASGLFDDMMQSAKGPKH